MSRWFESQIEMRAKFDEEATDRAFAELAASVSDYRPPLRVSWDDYKQVDGAAKVCLHYCGVEAGEVPEGETDPEERLEYLCRPSATMRRNVRLDEGWHTRAFGALLGKLDTGEPVPLLPRVMGGYQYLDPATGEWQKVNGSNAARIQPEAVFFYRPLPARALTVRDLLTFMFSVFDAADYALVIIAMTAATLVGLLPAWANQVAFGVVVPSGQESLIAPIGALLTGVMLSTVLINICRNLIMQRVSLKMSISAEAATFSRVLSLPTSFFKQYASGNLSSRVSQMNALSQQVVSLVLGTGISVLFSLVYLVQIGYYASSLTVPALIVAVLQAAFTVLATIVAARYDQLAMEASAKLSGTVTALLNGIQKIKLAGAEDRAFARWAHGYAEYARPSFQRPFYVVAIPAIAGIIGLLGTIALYYFAGSTRISVADYLTFNVAYGQMTGALMALSGAASQVARINPMVEMAAPILEAVPEVSEDKPSVSSLTGGIEVSDVSFRYEGNDQYVLRDLSLKVRPGEYVALVGKSGCGKSTIMRLLLGFETPERGSIFYGPYDTTKVDMRSLRRHIGVVMQDGRLFMGDIASNITISNPMATLDDAWEAAELAGIADDIRKMPMGMQTIVSEGGGGISGGQRQRLMIARAICGKRRILMLDEATSALDNKTQKHVSDSLDSLKCTRIVVAHRLSTVRHCDRILVVDGGRIAEEGTYDELIAKDGLFAELVARQRLDAEA